MPSVVELLREPTWLGGVILLVAAFGTFVISTRLLPLPTAEVVRAFYPVLTVVLEHAYFRSRVNRREVGGAALVLAGPALIASSGGIRGVDQAPAGTALAMAVVLLGVLVGYITAGRIAVPHPAGAGWALAVLSGLAFTVVDIGVRSIPAPVSLAAVVTEPACWVGAAAAPVGLLLFSRSVSLITAGQGTVVLTVVNVAFASAWSFVVFGDTTAAAPWELVTAVAAAAVGLVVMNRSSGARVMSPPDP